MSTLVAGRETCAEPGAGLVPGTQAPGAAIGDPGELDENQVVPRDAIIP